MIQNLSHKWNPISDLPEEASSLASAELRSLASVWAEQRVSLAASGALDNFNDQLRRQWAIETGIIERVYSLDRGVTQLLIEKGIDASLIPSSATDKNPELVAAMIRDHEEAVEVVFAAVKGERPLSTSYIKQLHAVLTRHQETTTAVDSLGRTVEVPLLRGEHKKLPNNPTRPDGSVHEYCPPEQVAVEMDRLIELYLSHEGKDIAPEVRSAWLHHAFTQIHPFQDGNGRVARALASLVLIRADWFPLAITEQDRSRYIEALESADDGDLKTLVAFTASILKRTFVNALSIAGEVQRRQQVDHVISAAREQLEKRRRAKHKAWEQAKRTAEVLKQITEARLDDIRERLNREIGSFSTEFNFYVDSELDGGPRGYYFRHQIIETAKELQYFANLGEYHSWVRLVLNAGQQAEVLISFHSVGHEFRGILAATMCFFSRTQTEEGERDIGDSVTVSDEMFQINYRELQQDAKVRFEDWLDRNKVAALEMWRAGL